MDQVVGMWLKAKSHAHPALSFVFTEESSSETRNLFQYSLEHIYIRQQKGQQKKKKKNCSHSNSAKCHHHYSIG